MTTETLTISFLEMVEKDSELRRVSTTNGGEYAGPCPFCGGRDRFHAQPDREDGPRWMCRHCTEGKWKDPPDYLMRRDGLDYQTARTRLNTGPRVSRELTGELRLTENRPAYQPPGDPWQEMAARVITRGEEELWGPGGTAAREYLQARGLREDTARTFHLGWSAGYWEKVEDRPVRVEAGVLIPCTARWRVWYIKSRLHPGIAYKCRKCKAERLGPGPCPACGDDVPRYKNITGSQSAAIFNAPALLGADVGLLVEGEFDAMIAAQELEGLGIAAATMGSAANLPDLATWGAYLVKPKRIAAAYDNDPAGDKGLEMLAKLAPKIERLHLPGEKDLNAYHLAGGHLRAWAIAALGLPVDVEAKVSARVPGLLPLPPGVLEDPALVEERELRDRWTADPAAYHERLQADIAYYLGKWTRLEELERVLPTRSLYPGDYARRLAEADGIAAVLGGLYGEREREEKKR
jgi:hypothetical protein